MMAARTQPVEALRSNSRTTAQGASILQRGLVVLQAALSLVLLVAAGLFAQSLNKAENVDMKLNTTNRYIAHINPQAAVLQEHGSRATVSDDRGSVPWDSRSSEGWPVDIYADGG